MIPYTTPAQVESIVSKILGDSNKPESESLNLVELDWQDISQTIDDKEVMNDDVYISKNSLSSDIADKINSGWISQSDYDSLIASLTKLVLQINGEDDLQAYINLTSLNIRPDISPDDGYNIGAGTIQWALSGYELKQIDDWTKAFVPDYSKTVIVHIYDDSPED